MAAGKDHTVLLRSDGHVVAVGRPLGDSAGDRAKFCSVPELPDGLEYTQIAAANYFVVLLRSDGRAITFIPQDDPEDSVSGFGNCDIPELPEGIRYVQVAAGSFHLALLRSDGQVLIGNDDYSAAEDKQVPELPEGLEYLQVAAGDYITAMLRSDGDVVVYDHKEDGEWPLSDQIPPLPDGLEYTQVSAGNGYVVLLRSDGHAQVVGKHGNALNDKCNIPELPEGVKYVQISAGKDGTISTSHIALLRSDGQVVVAGKNDIGQCNTPELPEGLRYTQISAGGDHTVLVRSDGQAFAVGRNREGQCDIPGCVEGLKYVQFQTSFRKRLVQLVVGGRNSGELQLTCVGLNGEELGKLNVHPSKECGGDLRKKLADEFGPRAHLHVVLPGARVLGFADDDIPLADLL